MKDNTFPWLCSVGWVFSWLLIWGAYGFRAALACWISASLLAAVVAYVAFDERERRNDDDGEIDQNL